MKASGHMTSALLLLAALVVGGISGAHASDIYQSEIAESTDMRGEDISDRTLEAFLIAAGQVQSIRASYAEMIREAPESERAELREGAVGDMTTAIEFSGLKVETYRAIGYLAQNDAEFKRRLDRVAAGN
ncbi:MAG: DUF4168 domain-containing protein [Ectothiorhodospiraceae bacterium]|nr:DUF4168 domain-containing protein [Ectothiorhodospiraceae bacterium]MCH8506103.1 DUF4168 domain-containing protein [Ectothiorhodospiraceae bacterium]